MRPGCNAYPVKTYCHVTNTCVLPALCPLSAFGTPTSPAMPSARRRCGIGELFCLHSAECVPTANVISCPVMAERYVTADNGPDHFYIVHSIVVKAKYPRYNYLDRYDIDGVSSNEAGKLLMTAGDVLAIEQSATGIYVAYETIDESTPSAISHPDGSLIRRRYFLRGILSHPVVARIGEIAPIHRVSAVVNSRSATGRVAHAMVQFPGIRGQY